MQRVLMGNQAIGRAIVEAGCAVAASYPGTPASEILEGVVAAARETGRTLHAEWSVNEKVAYEVALAASYTGKRAAVAMKQVGLNVAADPFMRSAYLGVKGGLLVVSADDPGPHSSQTEQDSRFFAMFARVPVLDPASPREAKAMVALALEVSEAYEIPVMLRPTTRVCHARQAVPLEAPSADGRRARFEKDPARWAATPGAVLALHRRLGETLDRLAADPRLAPAAVPGDGSFPGTCLVASGVAWAHARDVLDALGLAGTLDLYQVRCPYPLAPAFVQAIRRQYARVLVLEETYPVIEMQLMHPGAAGKGARLVPREGELTPAAIRAALQAFLGLPTSPGAGAPAARGPRPTLCAGCGHRAAFFAMRQAFPRGIFPGDIGCYTLGVNLGAVDTCHCMGAGISQAAGFYHAYAQDGPDFPTIVATIGDSTFFHSGIPALINAASQRARFILVILDNASTAMTGHQPTPASGRTAAGAPAVPVQIADLVQAAGVGFLRTLDPYDVPAFTACLKEADAYCRSDAGGVAVVIASHPCVLQTTAPGIAPGAVAVSEECSGCQACLTDLECPAILWDEAAGRVRIDEAACRACGVCLHACPTGCFVLQGAEP
ncbi:MAG: thiamine pyrophosphate-dependent enzyme [Candidatus Methylomirabilales bacterium]